MTELHNDCQYWAGKRPSFLGLMAKYSPFLPSQPHSPTVFFLLQETTNDDLGLSIAKDTCPQTNGRCQAWKRQFFERAQFLIVTSFQFSSWYSTTESQNSVLTSLQIKFKMTVTCSSSSFIATCLWHNPTFLKLSRPQHETTNSCGSTPLLLVTLRKTVEGFMEEPSCSQICVWWWQNVVVRWGVLSLVLRWTSPG